MAFWHENCGVGPELYMKNATKQSRCPRPGLLAGTKHKTAEARNIKVVPRNYGKRHGHQGSFTGILRQPPRILR